MGPRQAPKDTDSRRASGSCVQVFLLPELVVRGVTIAPTLPPRSNACKVGALFIALFASGSASHKA